MRSLRIVHSPARRRGMYARLAFLLVLVASPLSASPAVRITGSVRDAQNGAAVANALVTLPSLHRSAFTDDSGRYTIEAVPGTVRVVVSRMGYARNEFEAIVPAAGELVIHVDLHCEPILVSPIGVRASLPLRTMTSDASADRTVTRGELNLDPLLSEPDYLRALSGGEVTIQPEDASGLHVRGGASDQVGYVIDDIPVFNPYHSTGSFSAWNPDAISQVDLLAAAATPASPDALSGTVSARTRTPGDEHHTRGTMSPSQVRAAVDGPVGRTRSGYLLGVTSAFPGLAFHEPEPSHVDGHNLDVLAKTESPLLGGRLRLLGYGSHTSVDAATAANAEGTAGVSVPRNEFAWTSRSLGAEWSRPVGRASFTLRSWLARGDVDVSWSGSDSLANLASDRREAGVVAMVGTPMAGGHSILGLRFQDMTSRYHYRPASGEAYALDVATPVATIFAEHARDLHRTMLLTVSLSGAFVRGETYVSPTAQLRWQPAASFSLTGTAARRRQFGQSLRNAESVVSNLFPADLYIGAGKNGVPVATSNIGILGAEHRPAGWLRLGAQAYARDFAGLALVAPDGADPFATNGFTPGSGRAYGASIGAAATLGRIAVLGTYGYQDVRLEYSGGRYVPSYGTAHSLEAGVTLAPWTGYSIRLGYEGLLGRRTTTSLGEIEYESVSLTDEGGEFGGSPAGWSGALGGAALPAYHRFDLGIRKSWLTRIGGRSGVLAAYGTVSNLMDRNNVLTFAVDPAGGVTPVEMRPFAPVVVGLDWQF